MSELSNQIGCDRGEEQKLRPNFDLAPIFKKIEMMFIKWN